MISSISKCFEGKKKETACLLGGGCCLSPLCGFLLVFASKKGLSYES